MNQRKPFVEKGIIICDNCLYHFDEVYIVRLRDYAGSQWWSEDIRFICHECRKELRGLYKYVYGKYSYKLSEILKILKKKW